MEQKTQAVTAGEPCSESCGGSDLPAGFLKAVAVAAIGLMVLFLPTPDGITLRNAKRDVLKVVSVPAMASQKIDIDLDLRRDNLASYLSSEIQLVTRQPDVASMPMHQDSIDRMARSSLERMAWASNHPAVIMSFNTGTDKRCRVVASAQSIDHAQSPLNSLMDLVKQRFYQRGLFNFDPALMAWRFALVHEISHCYWNGLLSYDLLRDGSQQRTLAKHLNESYMDAMATILLSMITSPSLSQAEDGEGRPFRDQAKAHQVLASTASEWRNMSWKPGDPYRTGYAILSAAQRVSNDQSAALSRRDSQVLHAMALASASDGAQRWLMEQGVDAAQAQHDVERLIRRISF